jgi:flagellar hook-associated protein 2
MSSSSSISSAATGTNAAAPISFSGIASGLDTSSIIQKLVSLDQIPITNLQNKETNIQAQQAALTQLTTNLTALQAASQQINTDLTFSIASGTSSNTSVATITTATGATPGTYNLTVNNLASAQKVASSAQSSVSTAVNQSGTFIVDGKAVSVVATDSLTSIAQKINSLGINVTASIINGGPGNSYLTVASNQTGASNGLQMSDLSGSVLANLGVLGSTTSVANPVTNGALSASFTDNSTPVGTLLNLATPPSGTVTINGVAVNVNMATDSLQTIANSINAANTGATASVSSNTNNGVTTYQLSLSGASSTPTLGDPNNILGALGVTQNNYSNQLIQAKDASFALDGVPLSSATNTVTTAIPGATLTLLQGATTSSGGASVPAQSTITLAQNTTGLTTDINSFVSAYNAVVDYVNQNSQLDTSTFQTGPLFGDFAATQAVSSITSFLFNNVPGTTGNYTNLTSLGFNLNSSGDLSLNSTSLSTALSTNFSSVAALFGSTGLGSNTNITYVASSSKTVSSSTPYPVNITQTATQGSYVAEAAQTAANPTAETLTFKGALMGGTNYSLNLNVNNTLAQTISQINSDSTLKNLVVASDDNGSLKISSLRYGTSGNFTVVSNQSATSSNSGIGVGSLGTAVSGLDVAGTINGEPATGSGQFLSGNTGNATTDGLQIEYQGVTTGNVGTITFSKGVASQMSDVITQLTNQTNGLITSEANSFTSQITDINSQISDLTTQMNAYQAQLQTEFTNMESAIAQLNSQQTALNSLNASLTGTSTSSSSSNTGTNASISGG